MSKSRAGILRPETIVQVKLCNVEVHVAETPQEGHLSEDICERTSMYIGARISVRDLAPPTA
eukprot:6478036-Amphidinium_carterae.3